MDDAFSAFAEYDQSFNRVQADFGHIGSTLRR